MNTIRHHGNLGRTENRTAPPKAWRESGLGAPADIDALNQQISHLEQQVLDLRLQLEQHDEDLAAALAANRELMTRLNATNTPVTQGQ